MDCPSVYNSLVADKKGTGGQFTAGVAQGALLTCIKF